MSGVAGAKRGYRKGRLGVTVGLLALVCAGRLAAQDPVVTVSPEQTITVPVGNSTLLIFEDTLTRVLASDPQTAEIMAITGTELMVHGRSVGSTTLVVWELDGTREAYTVVVTVDPGLVQQQFLSLFPNEQIVVRAAGNTLVLSGEVSSQRVAREAGRLAEAGGVQVVDQLEVAAPDQVLLQVRLAEVTRNALRNVGAQFLAEFGDQIAALGADPFDISDQGRFDGTLSDALNLFLFLPGADLSLFIEALETQGVFRSLAEPNLLALDGEEASFLAGGEFPYPVVQGGGAAGNPSISIQFREFGVRLNFMPTITGDGRIRLFVAPEVSTLDFSSGLQVSGFQVPALLARRAETEVELRDGQTLAIAGLMDNSITENVSGIPLLSRIPIVGRLFGSRDLRQRRTELVVLVTPHLVRPTDPVPPLPVADPDEWDWLELLGGPLPR